MTKQCTLCKEIKPLTDFHKKNSAKSGLQSPCKICAGIRGIIYYAKNKEKVKLAKKKNRSDKTRESEKKYSKQNPKKRYAHRAAQYAVQKGLLQKPTNCECCGLETTQLVKHHSDYDKPLDVTWFCNPCHGMFHRMDFKSVGKVSPELIVPSLIRKR